MRSLRYSVAVFGLLGLLVPAEPAGRLRPKDLLKFRPTQPGRRLRHAADQAAINACKVEMVTVARTAASAMPCGTGREAAPPVRRHRRHGKMDQWSYYQDGFEVYRENDLDGDRSLDECRWINAGGTRIATCQEGEDHGLEADLGRGGLEGLRAGAWSRRGDLALLETVMATPDELAAAGLPKDVDRQGRRGRRAAGRDRSTPFRRRWSAGTGRRSGTGSTALFRT